MRKNHEAIARNMKQRSEISLLVSKLFCYNGFIFLTLRQSDLERLKQSEEKGRKKLLSYQWYKLVSTRLVALVSRVSPSRVVWFPHICFWLIYWLDIGMCLILGFVLGHQRSNLYLWYHNFFLFVENIPKTYGIFCWPFLLFRGKLLSPQRVVSIADWQY